MPKTAVIIPCYNEANRLKPELLQTFFLRKPGFKLILVNDGSSDGTDGILASIQQVLQDQCAIVVHEKRRGKAEAVRSGFLKCIEEPDIEFCGYLDADLAVSLEEFERLATKLESTAHDFILGCRIKKVGSRIIRNEWRHFYSRIIATFVGYVTKLDVYDTQCSAKIFCRSLLPVIATNPYRTKWLFDVELIDRIRKHVKELNEHGYEEPLLYWNEEKGSKLRWYNFPRILRELFILRKHNRK
jgi:glycosyltransferase involved in cell wall biosynthesis